jgi:serine/threonine-protein kinase TNNI3K
MSDAERARDVSSDLARLRDVAVRDDWLVDVPSSSCALERSLGCGSSGEAFLASWRGARVVVKTMKLLHDDDDARKALARRAFVRECEIMARLRHPNVLAFYGANTDANGTNAHVVCEYAPGGTLKQWLYENKGKKRSLSARLEMGLDIARAFAYLESRTPRVMHRDLKPSNVFVSVDGRALVADFGLARFVAQRGEDLTGETGTYIYMAPEVIKSQHYDERADVYSYGILLYELVTGIEPYQPHHLTGIQIATAVADREFRPKIPDSAHAGLVAIIEMCWQQDASTRPSFERVRESMETMVPDILKEEETKLAAQREHPSFQAKTLQNLSSTFADWSKKMSDLAS